MVRMYPVVPQHVDSTRIAAWSAAIALHLLALMLLLIPAAYVAAPLPRDAPQVRWIPPATAPPPAPPASAPTPITPPQPRTHALPQLPPLPVPAIVQQQAPSQALPAAEPAPSTTAPAIEPAAPGIGVQLQYRSAPPPAYPIAAVRNHEQGTVLLRVEVDHDGKPAAVSIERSSGSRALDHAARQQVLRHWRFVPAMQDGRATPAVGLVPIEFSLPQ